MTMSVSGNPDIKGEQIILEHLDDHICQDMQGNVIRAVITLILQLLYTSLGYSFELLLDDQCWKVAFEQMAISLMSDQLGRACLTAGKSMNDNVNLILHPLQ